METQIQTDVLTSERDDEDKSLREAIDRISEEDLSSFSFDPLGAPRAPSLDPTSSHLAFLPEQLQDQEWRLENLYYIKDKQGMIVKFKLKDFQRRLLKTYAPRNIILKARQMGFSTFIALFFLDSCLFRENISAAIVADKEKNGKNIFKKIEFAWSNFDSELKKSLELISTSDSTTEMAWSNGSSVIVGTTIHSGTYQLLHISELGPLCASSPEKAEDVMKSALPTVPDEGGIVFIESTAEGEGNEFHERCLEAMAKKERIDATKEQEVPERLSPMDFQFNFFPWYEEPSYKMEGEYPFPREIIEYFKTLERQINLKLSQEQKTWYSLKAQGLKRRMKEQYPSTPDEAFLSSGNKLFDPELLQKKAEAEVRRPIEVINNLVIFKHYIPSHAYGIGGDVALGSGLDSSTACIIDFTTNEVVATYASNTVDPVVFAYELARMGRMYGGCIIAPEANNIGHTTCVKLSEIYPNIYRYELKGYDTVTQTIRLGWITNVATKPRMLYELAEAFFDDVKPLIVPDAMILREARLYNKEDTMVTTAIAEMKTTRHFDLLIACAIGWQLRGYAKVSMASGEQRDRVDTRRERVKQGSNRFA